MEKRLPVWQKSSTRHLRFERKLRIIKRRFWFFLGTIIVFVTFMMKDVYGEHFHEHAEHMRVTQDGIERRENQASLEKRLDQIMGKLNAPESNMHWNGFHEFERYLRLNNALSTLGSCLSDVSDAQAVVTDYSPLFDFVPSANKFHRQAGVLQGKLDAVIGRLAELQTTLRRTIQLRDIQPGMDDAIQAIRDQTSSVAGETAGFKSEVRMELAVEREMDDSRYAFYAQLGHVCYFLGWLFTLLGMFSDTPAPTGG